MIDTEHKIREIRKMLSDIVDDEFIRGIYKYSKYDKETISLGDYDVEIENKGVFKRNGNEYDVSLLRYIFTGDDFILISKKYKPDEYILETPELMVYKMIYEIDDLEDDDYQEKYFKSFKTDFEANEFILNSLITKDSSKYNISQQTNNPIRDFINLYDAISWLENEINFNIKFTNPVLYDVYSFQKLNK